MNFRKLSAIIIGLAAAAFLTGCNDCDKCTNVVQEYCPPPVPAISRSRELPTVNVPSTMFTAPPPLPTSSGPESVTSVRVPGPVTLEVKTIPSRDKKGPTC